MYHFRWIGVLRIAVNDIARGLRLSRLSEKYAMHSERGKSCVELTQYRICVLEDQSLLHHHHVPLELQKLGSISFIPDTGA